AVRGCTRPTAAVWATAATSSRPAAATSSSCPESIDCQAGCRARCRWLVTGCSAALDHAKRGGRVVVILSLHHAGEPSGRTARLALPALPAQGGDECLHQHRVVLGPRPLAQPGDSLLDPPGAAVEQGRGHRV